MINTELDTCPAYGWQVTPEFNTLITQIRSGMERRRSLWTQVRHRFILPLQNIKDSTYLLHVKSAFLAAMGSAESFLVKDYSDFEAVNEVFAVGDGVETDFDISVISQFGSATYTRLIRYPVDPVFMVNGVPVAATFNTTTKKVEFAAAPANATSLSWTGEFRICVRFTSDALPMTIDNRSGDDYIMNGSIELMEVLE